METPTKYPGQPQTRNCPWCGVEFSARRGQKYCRDSHRASMWSYTKKSVALEGERGNGGGLDGAPAVKGVPTPSDEGSRAIHAVAGDDPSTCGCNDCVRTRKTARHTGCGKPYAS